MAEAMRKDDERGGEESQQVEIVGAADGEIGEQVGSSEGV